VTPRKGVGRDQAPVQGGGRGKKACSNDRGTYPVGAHEGRRQRELLERKEGNT